MYGAFVQLFGKIDFDLLSILSFCETNFQKCFKDYRQYGTLLNENIQHNIAWNDPAKKWVPQ